MYNYSLICIGYLLPLWRIWTVLSKVHIRRHCCWRSLRCSETRDRGRRWWTCRSRSGHRCSTAQRTPRSSRCRRRRWSTTFERHNSLRRVGTEAWSRWSVWWTARPIPRRTWSSHPHPEMTWCWPVQLDLIDRHISKLRNHSMIEWPVTFIRHENRLFDSLKKSDLPFNYFQPVRILKKFCWDFYYRIGPSLDTKFDCQPTKNQNRKTQTQNSSYKLHLASQIKIKS